MIPKELCRMAKGIKGADMKQSAGEGECTHVKTQHNTVGLG